MTGMRVGAVAVLAVLAAAGCGPIQPGRVGAPVSPRDDTGRIHQQAVDALDRWDAAVTAAGGRTGFAAIDQEVRLSGPWEPAVAENNKAALTAGRLDLSGVDGRQRIPAGQVVWADGTTQPVRTISLDEAVRRLRSPGNPAFCGTCTPLRITAARPVTVDVDTTRGRASAPAWELSVAGSAVVLRQLAVARDEGVEVSPPPWDATNTPAGHSIERAVVAPGGRRLTASLIGARYPASEPCGIDYLGEVLESANAVVVIVTDRRHSGDDICLAIGFYREVVVELAAPLDDRAVLEVRTGMPVPVLREQ